MLGRLARLLLLLPVLALSACGGNTAGETTPSATLSSSPSSSPSSDPTQSISTSPTDEASIEPTAEASSEPARNDKGNIELAAGRQGTVTPPGEDTAVMTIKMTKAVVDPGCTPSDFGEVSEPKNGHFLLLYFEVTTTKKLNDILETDQAQLNPNWFQVYDPSGFAETGTVTQETYGCVPQTEQLPSHFAPGTKAKGVVVLDVKSPKGSVHFGFGDPSGGWEWTYPAK